jgi:hypothetical protein
MFRDREKIRLSEILAVSVLGLIMPFSLLADPSEKSAEADDAAAEKPATNWEYDTGLPADDDWSVGLSADSTRATKVSPAPVATTMGSNSYPESFALTPESSMLSSISSLDDEKIRNQMIFWISQRSNTAGDLGELFLDRTDGGWHVDVASDAVGLDWAVDF